MCVFVCVCDCECACKHVCMCMRMCVGVRVRVCLYMPRIRVVWVFYSFELPMLTDLTFSLTSKHQNGEIELVSGKGKTCCCN